MRRAALGLLAALRALHAALAAAAEAEGLGAEPGAYLADVFEEGGRDIARRCYWDFGRWSDTWRAWRAPADDAAAGASPDLEARPGMHAPSPVRCCRCASSWRPTVWICHASRPCQVLLHALLRACAEPL